MKLTQELNKSQTIKLILLFISVALFLLIVENVYDKEIMVADIAGYNFISTHIISDFATPIAKVVTNLGGAGVLILITIILAIVLKNKKISLSIAINLIIITLLNLLLKHIVQRPRPTEFRMISESGYSFPSGHSMVSMAFYGYFIYLIHKNIENKILKWILISTLSIVILAIGTSRIYLGVHYTSDVLAGFIISFSYLIIYTSIVKRLMITEKWKE